MSWAWNEGGVVWDAPNQPGASNGRANQGHVRSVFLLAGASSVGALTGRDYPVLPHVENINDQHHETYQLADPIDY